MDNQAGKPEKKRRFFKNVKGKKRFILFTGIYLILFLIFFVVSAELTSRPSFCPTCHYMETFHQSWRTSSHNKVDCIECHMEPGITGMVRGKINGLVMVVNYVTKSYTNRRPWAEIPDNTCIRSGCHETQASNDSVYHFKGVSYNHKNHLGELRRGKKLKCTSCHSQIVQGTHIMLTPTTCYNCHFKKTGDIENVSSKLFDCKTCHSLQMLSGEQSVNVRYDHSYTEENQISCIRCHSNVTAGDGIVEKDRCIQCHFEIERLEKFDKVDTVHTIHISEHNVPCYYCHSKINHVIQRAGPIFSRSCSNCHSDLHSPQFSLFAGENGFNVERTPSAMYLKGINCDGCHLKHMLDNKGKKSLLSAGTSCENCHQKGFDNLMRQWETATLTHLSEINSIYSKASSQILNSSEPRKEEALDLLMHAKQNIELVKEGKSVHNILYTDKLFRGSYELLKKALTVTGSNYKLPEYLSSSDFIPNECYNCHSGIEEISKKVNDMNFSHNKHIISNKISCSKCHSNEKKHGELIISKQNCNSCHHANVSFDDDCSKCHQLQVRMFSGTYLNRNEPDYMKAAGVKCIDCHSKDLKIIKPTLDICSKCHDNSYKEQAAEWENEFKKMLKEAGLLLNSIPEKNLTNEQKSSLNESRQIISDLKLYRSIFVHNHELISSLLTEKLKYLKTMQFALN